MKTKIVFTLTIIMLLVNLKSIAQWIRFGTPTSNMRTSNNIRISTDTLFAPTSKVEINSASGQNALRVFVSGVAKLSVASNGGVSVGSPLTPPDNGLFVSGNAGFGTAIPDNKLHVMKGSAGSVTGNANSPLVVENSTSCYVNILAPNSGETGVLFGKPGDNVSGGIVYNSGSVNGMQFRTNGNVARMTLSGIGNLGIGTDAPSTRLHVLGGSDASLGGGGYIVTGSTAGKNVAIDDNEIMARNNGAASTLFLNSDGGNLDVSDEAFVVNGTTNKVGIGTSSPTNLLQVGTTTGSTLGIGTAESLTDAGSSTISSNANFIPASSCALNLGSSTNRWNQIWACDGTIHTSDLRAKKNIRNLEYGIKEIMKLRAVKFNWIDNPDQNDKIGFIAQEIKQVLPEVVRDYEYKQNEKTGAVEKVPVTMIGVNYSEIIPVLIRSIQQQQEMIEAQNKKIEELNKLVLQPSSLNYSLRKETGYSTSNAFLEQNVPNPFTNTTTINYTLPQKFTDAQIIISDKNGKAFRKINLSGTGKGAVQINASTFSSGTFYYSLYIDGQLIASKQMILAK